jgi:uncharacterized membrane protein
MVDTLPNTALRDLFEYLIIVVEACGGLVILVGVARAIFGFVRGCVLRYDPTEVTSLRIQLGKSMVFALEFQVAADILKTGLSPTWQDILLLGAIIALRTILNYLLERELEILDPEHPMAAGRRRTRGNAGPSVSGSDSVTS